MIGDIAEMFDGEGDRILKFPYPPFHLVSEINHYGIGFIFHLHPLVGLKVFSRMIPYVEVVYTKMNNLLFIPHMHLRE